MTKTDRRRWFWRLRRGIMLRLPGGAGITFGRPGRHLRIGWRGLSIWVGQSALGLTISWRRSWRRLWSDVLHRRRAGARSHGWR